MSLPTSAQSDLTPEEKELAKQVAIAEAKKKIAQAEFDAAKAKKDAADLNDPLTDKERAVTAKEIAVAEKEAALARRDLFKGPEITGNTGKITHTGDFIEGRILAQRSLSKVCNEMVEAMGKVSPFDNNISLVIYNAADFPAMELYASMLDNLAVFEAAYIKANKAAKDGLEAPYSYTADAITLAADPLLTGFAASGIIRTAADIVSLFRTTTDYKNTDIIVDETAIAASLKDAILKNKKTWKVYQPALYPVNTILGDGTPSPFVTGLNKIKALSGTADARIAALDLKIQGIKTAMAAETDAAKKRRMQKHINFLEPFITELKSLNSSFTQLQTILTTTDATAKVSAQALLLRAERMVKKLKSNDVYVIKLAAASKGSNKIRENLWRNASMKHSAGTELSVLVFDPSGELIYSDQRASYTPYTASEDIK